jgi:CRP/FNR family transcriptional regulator
MARLSQHHESTRDRLRRLRLFAELEDEALDRLAGLSRVIHVARKEELFREGEPYRGAYVVLEGLAVVYRMSADGRMLILQVCRPGDTFAQVPLFEEEDAGHPASARSTRPSEILFLPKKRFVPFLKQHPEVAWEMLRGLAAQVKELTMRLEGVTLREVTSRLARYLLREIEAGGVDSEEPPVLMLPLTKGSVASYLGTVHETLSRTFARLIRDRVIAVEGRRITILDRDKLEQLV